jgi:hypothetical protein
MITRLAGNNILVIDRSPKEAARISEGFKALGANVFAACDQVRSKALQQRWDIDIIVCDVSFLSDLGEVVVAQPIGGQAKNSPFLFVYGQASFVHPKLMEAKGVIKYFSGVINPHDVAPLMSAYLYDAKKHLEQLAESSVAREISFILQNGIETFALEVSEFSADGLVAALVGGMTGETGSLTVLVPDAAVQRFAVRFERKSGEGDIIKLRLLWRDRERWMALLETVDQRQKQIIDFLTASSGK